MTQQPEALRLAESLEADFKSDTFNFDDMIEAAAELRRLYAEVDRLSYRLAYPDNFAREWVGLTDEEIDQGLLRSDYALQTAHAWRAGVVFAMTQLKERNHVN